MGVAHTHLAIERKLGVHDHVSLLLLNEFTARRNGSAIAPHGCLKHEHTPNALAHASMGFLRLFDLFAAGLSSQTQVEFKQIAGAVHVPTTSYCGRRLATSSRSARLANCGWEVGRGARQIRGCNLRVGPAPCSSRKKSIEPSQCFSPCMDHHPRIPRLTLASGSQHSAECSVDAGCCSCFTRPANAC
jgi:hypothetical protein